MLAWRHALPLGGDWGYLDKTGERDIDDDWEAVHPFSKGNRMLVDSAEEVFSLYYPDSPSSRS